MEKQSTDLAVRSIVTRRNSMIAAATIGLGTVLVPGQALAAAGDATYSLSGATDGIVSQVQGVLTTVLPIAGGLIALAIGWKLLKRMTKSA